MKDTNNLSEDRVRDVLFELPENSTEQQVSAALETAPPDAVEMPEDIESLPGHILHKYADHITPDLANKYLDQLAETDSAGTPIRPPVSPKMQRSLLLMASGMYAPPSLLSRIRERILPATSKQKSAAKAVRTNPSSSYISRAAHKTLRETDGGHPSRSESIKELDHFSWPQEMDSMGRYIPGDDGLIKTNPNYNLVDMLEYTLKKVDPSSQQASVLRKLIDLPGMSEVGFGGGSIPSNLTLMGLTSTDRKSRETSVSTKKQTNPKVVIHEARHAAKQKGTTAPKYDEVRNVIQAAEESAREIVLAASELHKSFHDKTKGEPTEEELSEYVSSMAETMPQYIIPEGYAESVAKIGIEQAYGEEVAQSNLNRAQFLQNISRYGTLVRDDKDLTPGWNGSDLPALGFYGLDGFGEFIPEAIASPGFRNFLSKTKVAQGGADKIISKMLGFSKPESDALSTLLPTLNKALTAENLMPSSEE